MTSSQICKQHADAPAHRPADALAIRVEEMAARFYPQKSDVRALASRTMSEIDLGATRRAPEEIRVGHHILAVMQRIVQEERDAGL